MELAAAPVTALSATSRQKPLHLSKATETFAMWPKLSYAEIGRALGIPRNTVASRLYKHRHGHYGHKSPPPPAPPPELPPITSTLLALLSDERPRTVSQLHLLTRHDPKTLLRHLRRLATLGCVIHLPDKKWIELP